MIHQSGGDFISGDDSRESGGVPGVFCRVNEVARSATDGDLDGSRTLALRTEKNVDDGRADRPASSPSAVLESFSSALMRCEMLDPTPFLAARLLDDDCCVILCKNAAPDETVLAELGGTSLGVSNAPRTGLETVRIGALGLTLAAGGECHEQAHDQPEPRTSHYVYFLLYPRGLSAPSG